MLVIIPPLSLGKMVDKRYEKINYDYYDSIVHGNAYGLQYF